MTTTALSSPWTGPDIITTAELARRTQTSPSTWEQRRIKGGNASPRFLRLGRSVRYRWSDVLEWMEAQSATSTSEARTDGR